MISFPAPSVPWASCAPLHPHFLHQRVPPPPLFLHRWSLPPPLSLLRSTHPAPSQSPSTVATSPASPRTPTPQQRTSVGTAWAWGRARAAPAPTHRGAAPPTESAAPGKTSSRRRWPARGCTSCRRRRARATTAASWGAWAERWGFTEDSGGKECPRRGAGRPRCPYGDTTQPRGTGSGTGPSLWSGAPMHTATHTDAPTSSGARVFPGTETLCQENCSTMQFTWKTGVRMRRRRRQTC